MNQDTNLFLPAADYLHLTGNVTAFILTKILQLYNEPTSDILIPSRFFFFPPNKVFLLSKIAAWNELLLPEQLKRVGGLFYLLKDKEKTKKPNPRTMSSPPLRSHPYRKSKNISVHPIPCRIQLAFQVSWALRCPHQISNTGSASFSQKPKLPVVVRLWKVSSPVQWGTLWALLCNTVLQGTMRGSRNSSSFMTKIKDCCTGSFHLPLLIPTLALQGFIFTSVSCQINELSLIFKISVLKPRILHSTM